MKFEPPLLLHRRQVGTLVGLLTSPPDWSKMVDESFLPDDLRKGKS